MKAHIYLFFLTLVWGLVYLASCSKETATFYTTIEDFIADNGITDLRATSSGLVYTLRSICSDTTVRTPNETDLVEIWCKGYLPDGTIVNNCGTSSSISDAMSVELCVDIITNTLLSIDTTEVYNTVLDIDSFRMNGVWVYDTVFDIDSSQMGGVWVYDSMPAMIIDTSEVYDTTRETVTTTIPDDPSPTSVVLPMSDLIFGLREGIMLLSPGDYAQFFIPTELAFGLNGSGEVPPNSDVIYEVELIRIIE